MAIYIFTRGNMQQRIFGLDLLRVIIMLFGPTFHAAMLMKGSFGFAGKMDESSIVNAILLFTNPFRMELFFIISGFFATLVIERKGASYYCQSRTKRVLKPTVFAILIILPLTISSIVLICGYSDITYHINYRHLWFMVTLSMISLSTMFSPSILLCKTKLIAKKLDSVSHGTIFLFFCAIIVTFHSLSLLIIRGVPEYLNLIIQLKTTIFYMSYFIIGMILYSLNKKPPRTLLALFLVLYTGWYIITIHYDTALPHTGWKLLVKDVFSNAMCICIFCFFYHLEISKNDYLERLSRIALPFYLIHLPLLIILSEVWLHATKSTSPVAYSLTVIPLTIVSSLLISVLLTRVRFINKMLGME